MVVMEIPLKLLDVSEYNTRKNIADGQTDSSIDDLARSIEKQGLLSPITVFEKIDGRYAVVAGQRRLLACRRLGWASIAAIVRYTVDEGDAMALSLVENVHRADMNPHDKALAFKALLDRLGDVQSVSNETGIGVATIKKYLALLDLAPQLQEKLAAGAVKGTEALVRLSRRFTAQEKQLDVWNKIDGYTQDVQLAVIKQVDSDLTNLNDLLNRAEEGTLAVVRARRCPFDCSEIPEALKKPVADLIAAYRAGQAART